MESQYKANALQEPLLSLRGKKEKSEVSALMFQYVQPRLINRTGRFFYKLIVDHPSFGHYEILI